MSQYFPGSAHTPHVDGQYHVLIQLVISFFVPKDLETTHKERNIQPSFVNSPCLPSYKHFQNHNYIPYIF